MKVLVINCGSSSLKYQLINMDTEKVMAKGNFERIGEQESFLTHKVNGEKYKIEEPVMNHKEALKICLNQLINKDYGVIESLDEIDSIGHRGIHGGENFTKSEIITPELMKVYRECIPLAPLHNPASILGIEACEEVMPNVPMTITFDTQFHQTMPEENYIFPLPYEVYEKHHIRRYGFHGTSHQFVSERVIEIDGRPKEDLKIVTCHLGQGSSICAIKGGKSIDTSMGLSPLSGIPMVTRCGDMDPAVVTQIMERENLDTKEVMQYLNKKSGLYGITGLTPDFREIESLSYDENYPKAALAITIYCKQIAKYIAEYAVSLGGIDIITFAGGVGENQINVRKKILSYLEWMGVKVDEERNNIRSEEAKISSDDSKVDVYVIPTNEELLIARDNIALLKK